MPGAYKAVVEGSLPVCPSPKDRGTNTQRFTSTPTACCWVHSALSWRVHTANLVCTSVRNETYHKPSTTAAQPWATKYVHYIVGAKQKSRLSPLKSGSGNRKTTCRWGKWVGKITVAQRQNFVREFATYGPGDWPTSEHLQSRSMSQGYGSFCHKFLTQQQGGKIRKSSCQHSPFSFHHCKN